jgi:hypothetical protein
MLSTLFAAMVPFADADAATAVSSEAKILGINAAVLLAGIIFLVLAYGVWMVNRVEKNEENVAKELADRIRRDEHKQSVAAQQVQIDLILASQKEMIAMNREQTTILRELYRDKSGSRHSSPPPWPPRK